MPGHPAEEPGLRCQQVKCRELQDCWVRHVGLTAGLGMQNGWVRQAGQLC